MQWLVLKNCLEKEFEFATSQQAANFAMEVKYLGKVLGHDADKLLQQVNKVKVVLTTHDSNSKITKKDKELAAKITDLFFLLGGRIKTLDLDNADANKVWQKLFQRQIKNLKDRVHPGFWEGLEKLSLAEKKLPDLDVLNKDLFKLANFQMERVQIQYAGDAEWFGFLFKRRITATNFIRILEDIDYTPLPDIFHDIFGHLPMLVNKQVANLAEKFGRVFLNALTDKQRFMTQRLWWNSLEFGIMEIKGKNLIIGAGLISSFGECNHVFGGNADLVEFNNELLPKLERSPHTFHNRFMIFKSFEQISEALDWIASHPLN